MAFGNLPASLQNAIQTGFLERAFVDPLVNNLAYRQIADQEIFPGRIGDTITKTRVGLMTPNFTPMDPSTNTNIDNGLTPQNYSTEQYTLAIQQVAQLGFPINLMDDETSIASFAMRNAENLGVAQATVIDAYARNPLFNAYMGGNTVVSLTINDPTPTISVDDVRGFESISVLGNMVPVSVGHPLPVFVNNVLYPLIGVTRDVVNTSSSKITGGISGILTFGVPIELSNGIINNTVISIYAPLIVRPAGKTSTQQLASSDLLNMSSILNAVAYLRNNNVPTVDGHYNLYLNATSYNQLFQDPEFQILNRGVSTRDPVYRDAKIYDAFLDVRFIMTTQTFVQPNQGTVPSVDIPVPVGVTVQRPIICGKGALIEGVFSKGLDAVKNMGGQGGPGSFIDGSAGIMMSDQEFSSVGSYQYMRMPIDSLGQIITQTSSYVGGFTVPTDVTTTTAIIPTASNAYYKRSVIIETA